MQTYVSSFWIVESPREGRGTYCLHVCTLQRALRTLRLISTFRHRDVRYRDVRYRDEGSFKICAIGIMFFLLGALSGCGLSGIMLNSVCAIGTWAIASCANGTHSTNLCKNQPDRKAEVHAFFLTTLVFLGLLAI